MMSWNYRVVRKVYEDGTVMLGIHEVFYNDEDVPNMVTVDAVDVEVEDEEGLESLKEVLIWMLTATAKPILEHSEIGK